MPSRRDFLKTTAATGGALLSGGLPALARAATHAAAPLNLLVLGGTGFIGPHLVRYAAGRGHKITIFTRGRHDAELPADVVRLQGDRPTELTALKENWDAIVDDSAKNPSGSPIGNTAETRWATTCSRRPPVFYPYLRAAWTSTRAALC
jgi:2'-hydroxyisoflavone reductase